MRRSMWLLVCAGCAAPSPATVGTDDLPIGSDPTGSLSTGTPPPTTATSAEYPRPTVLSMICSPTPNALRFGCEVTVEPPQPVQVAMTPSDGTGLARTFTSDAALGLHLVPVTFMAPDSDYELVATATAWPTAPVSINQVHSGLPPQGLGSWLEMTGTSTMGLIGTNLPCDNDAIAVIYDTATGDLVWYQDLDSSGVLGNNDMVRFTAQQTVLGETSSSVVEMDLFGNVVYTLDAGSDYSAGLHHDINTYDGVYYGLELYQYTTEPNGGAQLDAVVMLDQETGDEGTRFWPHEHFAIPPDATGDWLHTNTVSIDEKGDLYLSYLTQNTLVKVRGLAGGTGFGGDFGTPLWVIEGQNGGLEKTLDLDWNNITGADLFGFQHSLSLRADGRIMVLDNTNGRALVITVDEAEERAVVDAAFDTVEFSCGPQGTAQETATGNVLSGCSGGNIREYEIGTGDLLWEASVTCRDGSSPYAVRWYALDGWL